MESTRKCPLCDEPYVVYAFYAGDQSACPKCRARARRLEGKYDSQQQARVPRVGKGCGA